MIVALSEVASSAKSKPPGFFEEALKRGLVKNGCLELSDEDLLFLKNFSSSSVDQKPVLLNFADVKSEPFISPSSEGKDADNGLLRYFEHSEYSVVKTDVESG
jgi:hypothetical protein